MRCSGCLVWKILDELRKMVGEGFDHWIWK
jgi:hypothetical protein